MNFLESIDTFVKQLRTTSNETREAYKTDMLRLYYWYKTKLKKEPDPSTINLGDVNSCIYDLQQGYDKIVLKDTTQHNAGDIVKNKTTKLSIASINRFIATIKKYSTFLRKYKIRRDNLAEFLDNFRVNKSSETDIFYFNEEGLRRFYNEICLSAVTGNMQIGIYSEKSSRRGKDGGRFKFYPTDNALRDMAVMSLLWNSGIRISEALSLTYKDGLYISNTKFEKQIFGKTQTPGYILMFPITGKGNKTRNVELKQRTQNWFKKYLTIRKNWLKKVPKKNQPKEFFIIKKGRALERKNFFNILKKYYVAKAVEKNIIRENNKLSPHSFRHSYSVISIQHNIDISRLKELLGHADISITNEYYMHIQARYSGSIPERNYTGGYFEI